jgi:hypothetical protein
MNKLFNFISIRKLKMNKFTKTVLAVAIMAGAGAANASITAVTTNDGTGSSLNEAFLVVYDPNFVGPGGLGRTYNLDLNITFADILANPSAAFAAYAGPTGLALDSSWSTFASGITNASAVKYTIAVGSEDDATTFVTAATKPLANPDPTVLVGQLSASNITLHAREINNGLAAGANSSVINQVPDNNSGQATHNGQTFDTLWGSATFNPNGVYNSTGVNFYKEAYIFDAGGTALTTQNEITNVGSWILAGNTLKYSAAPVAAVPLPAAVWMFGAGLMGLLRVNRRKSVAI